MAVLVKRRWPLAVPALLATHLVTLAALSPIAKDDWPVLLGDRPAATAGGWLHAALVTIPGVHVVATPLVALALVIAIAWLALGRRPDLFAAADVATLALASTLVWWAAPRAAVVLSYRGAAPDLYAACGVLWLAIAWRFNPRGIAAAVALVTLGAFAGSCARATGTAALVVATAELARDRAARTRAGVAATVGLAAGVALVWLAPPAPDLERGVSHILHDAMTALRAPIVVAAGVLALAIVERVRGRDPDAGALGATLALAARAVPAAAVAGIVVEPRRAARQPRGVRRGRRGRGRRHARGGRARDERQGRPRDRDRRGRARAGQRRLGLDSTSCGWSTATPSDASTRSMRRRPARSRASRRTAATAHRT